MSEVESDTGLAEYNASITILETDIGKNDISLVENDYQNTVLNTDLNIGQKYKNEYQGKLGKMILLILSFQCRGTGLMLVY